MVTCFRCSRTNDDTTSFCAKCFSPLFLVGRYRIGSLVRPGGMARVFQAWDYKNGVLVAIKEMESSQFAIERNEAVRRFRAEASLLARFNHPRLPKFTDYFEEQGRFFLVMEFIEGDDLENFFHKNHPLGEVEVLRWAVQICEILEHLHGQSPPIIHRDIKPSNLILSKDRGIVLVDLGIAKVLGQNDSGTRPAGAVAFAAPEQLQGVPDERSDLYSLGLTLFHLLTGLWINPFDPEPVKVERTDLTAGLLFFFNKAVHRDPAQRYQSAGEMKKNLEILQKSRLEKKTGILVGKITDKKTRLPLRDVRILLGKHETQTDDAGTFLILDAPHSRQTLTVKLPKYFSWAREITCAPDKGTKVDVALRPLPSLGRLLRSAIYLLLLVWLIYVFLFILEQRFQGKAPTVLKFLLKRTAITLLGRAFSVQAGDEATDVRMAMDGSGFLYFLLPRSKKVMKYSREGKLSTSWQLTTSNFHPDDIKASRDGKIFVLMPRSILEVFSPEGRHLQTLDLPLPRKWQWFTITPTSDGGILTLVREIIKGAARWTPPHSLSKFDLSGNLLFRRTGGFLDTCSSPLMTTDSRDNILVLDLGHGTLGRFDPNGVQESIHELFTSDFANLTSMACDSKGNIYIADPEKKRVYTFGPNGRRLGVKECRENGFETPVSLAVGPDGKIYVYFWEENVRSFSSKELIGK